MKKLRHSQQNSQNSINYKKSKQECVSEKLLFMERWGLLPMSKEGFDESSLHEVEVHLKNMSKEQIPEFIKKEFVDYYELLEVEDNYVRLLYFLDSATLDPAMIDVVLFDIFGDYELGIYHSYQIK